MPRRLIFLTAGIVFCIAGGTAYSFYRSLKHSAAAALVEIDAFIAPRNCTQNGYPLQVSVINTSGHVVRGVEFRLSASEIGHAADLAEGQLQRIDALLLPGAHWSRCWRLDRLKRATKYTGEATALVWQAKMVRVEFE